MKIILRIFRFLAVLIYLPSKVAWLSIQGRFRNPVERRRKAVIEIQHTAKTLCRIMGLHVNVIGALPTPEKGLVVATHLGYVDMLVLASVLPVCFVAKSELKTRPILGWIARTFETIFVARDDKTKHTSFVYEVQTRLYENFRILVFPEGRATFSDQVYPFKTGTFEALVGTDIPVIPLYFGIESIEHQKPVGDIRWKICWHDPMPIYRHIWQLFGLKKTLFCVEPCDPFLPEDMDRRKMAAQAESLIREKHQKWNPEQN